MPASETEDYRCASRSTAKYHEPLGAQWMIQLHDYLQSKLKMAVTEFKGAKWHCGLPNEIAITPV